MDLNFSTFFYIFVKKRQMTRMSKKRDEFLQRFQLCQSDIICIEMISPQNNEYLIFTKMAGQKLYLHENKLGILGIH